MTKPDPIISKLVELKRKDQERQLLAIQSELKLLFEKLAELDAEEAKLDDAEDGYGRMSVENGYLKYVEHRRQSLQKQIDSLKSDAETAQAALRKSLFSQSMLDDAAGA